MWLRGPPLGRRPDESLRLGAGPPLFPMFLLFSAAAVPSCTSLLSEPWPPTRFCRPLRRPKSPVRRTSAPRLLRLVLTSTKGRAKSDTGADKQEGRAVYSLSCLELTRAFLDHDLQLRQLQASVTVVYKFDEKEPFAQLLLTAVRAWQSHHTPGQPHPYGACSSAVASALLNDLQSDEECPPPLQVLLTAILDGSDMTAVAREISLCSARLNAKKTAVIVEFRPHVGSPLHAYLPTVQLFLAKKNGEKLSMRPQGALARKAQVVSEGGAPVTLSAACSGEGLSGGLRRFSQAVYLPIFSQPELVVALA